MKKLLTVLFLSIAMLSFAQEKKEMYVEITSLKFTVNSLDELKTIKWNDIKESVKKKNNDELINLEFVVDIPKTNNNSKLKYTYVVEGKSEDIDDLITSIKKGLNGIKTVSKGEIRIDLSK